MGRRDLDLAPSHKIGFEMCLLRMNAFKPEFIFFSAGFDAHQNDPLANFNLRSEDFYQITKRSLEVSKKYCNGNVVSILEGGYDLQALAESSEQHIKALMQYKKE